MRSFSSYPNLTVIGFDFPIERNTELIKPNLAILEHFCKHKLHFATSGLSIKEVASFFRKKEHAFNRGADYEYRLISRKAYLNELKRQSDQSKFFCMLDYSSNVRNVLTLENQLKKNGISYEESARIKEKILFLQTFERAKMIFNQIPDPDKPNLLFADISLAYALHLITDCEIHFDLPKCCANKPEQLEKMREGIFFFYKAFSGEVKLFPNEMTSKKSVFFSRGNDGQGLVHNEKGVQYVSNTETFYLMNGKPQNGFCLTPELNQYSLTLKQNL